MSYKHKSGAQKRKEKADREAEVGQHKPITIFFKKQKVDEEGSLISEGPPSSIDHHGGNQLDAIESSSSSGIEEISVGDSPANTGPSISTSSTSTDSNDPRGTPRLIDHHCGNQPDPIESSSGIKETSVSDSPPNPGPSTSTPSTSIDYNDPGTWHFPLSDRVRQEIVLHVNEFKEFVKETEFFPKDTLGRNFPQYLLNSKTFNKREYVSRDWLIWSKTKQTLHCLPCLLFSDSIVSSSPAISQKTCRSKLAKSTGFSPKVISWKKLYGRLPSHEQSPDHMAMYCQWKTLKESLKGRGVDAQIQQQIQSEAEKWKAILERVLHVTLFLASRGLPFRGDNVTIGDVSNGNFLGILEVIAQYDDVTREHLERIKSTQVKGDSMKGQAHYLSWKSQNEFISLCGDHVLKTILQERNESIYFGLIVDATPDISHQEQNVLVLRYVHRDKDTKNFEVYERFIKFLNFNEKTGADIAAEILSELQILKIPLTDCRAQGYDGGSNMCGKVKGVKSRLLESNKLAFFSPCAAHSLNRVGVNAAKICHQVVTFFGNLESLYSFFSSSPSRWEILRKEMPLSLKRQSETRWSERIEAVRPVIKHYPGLLKTLERVLTEMSTSLKPAVLNTVRGLKKYFTSFEGLLMAIFWHKVLASIDERSVIIQSEAISLDVEMKLINDLRNDIQLLRDSWEKILEEAKTMAEVLKIPSSFQLNRASASVPHQLSPEDKFRNEVVFVVLDFLLQNLDERFTAGTTFCELFSPILQFTNLEQDSLREKASTLVKFYKSDLSSSFVEEILHLKKIYSTVFQMTSINPLKLLNAIYEKQLDPVFINVCVALRIFCTAPVTVASAERAFSKLGTRLKTWERASMGQERLNSLAILSIEHKLAAKLDFSKVIKEFSLKKARKF